MSLAHPSWLLLAPVAGAVIVLLHMRRRTQRTVPSLVVWRRVAAASVPSADWRRPPLSLPLLLQLLAVVALALAAAGPSLERRTDRHVLTLIDVSASMGASVDGPALVERARDEAQRVLAERGPRSVALVAGGLHPIAWHRTETADVQTELAQAHLAPEATPADWPGAAAFVSRLAGADVPDRVVVVSDEPDRAREAFAARGVEIETIGLEGASRDAGLVHAEIAPALERPGPRNAAAPRASGTRMEVRATVGAVGEPLPAGRLELAFRPEGAASDLAWGDVRAALDDGSELATEIAVPGPGLLRLRLTDADGAALPGWPGNDEVVLRVRPDPAPRTVATTGSTPDAWTSLLAGIDGLELRPEAGGVDLLVAFGSAPPEDVAASALWHVATGPAVADDTWVQDAIVAWAADGVPGGGLDWGGLPPLVVRPTAPLPGATILVEGGAGPWAQARVTDGRRELHTSFDPNQLAGVDGSTLAAFVLDALAWLAPADEPCRVGQPCDLTPGATVTDPAGTLFATATPGEATPRPAAFVPRRAGLHRVVVGTGEESQLPVLPPTVRDRPAGSLEGSTAAFRGRPARPDPLRLLAWAVAAGLILGEGAWAAQRFRRERSDRPRQAVERRRAVATAIWTAGAAAAIVSGLATVPVPLWQALRTVVVVAPAGEGDLARQTEERLGRGVQVLRQDTASGAPVGTTAAGVSARLAAARVPRGAAGRVVMVDLGEPSSDDASAAAPELAAAGVEAVLVTDERPRPALALGEAHVPERVRESDRADVDLETWSDASRSATLTVERDGVAVAERSVELPSGRSLLSVPLATDVPGVAGYRVILEGDAGPSVERTFLAEVGPAPRWTLVSPLAERGEAFAEALRLQGLDVDVIEPAQAPFRVEAWQGVDGVILADVPALELHPDQQAAIERFVAEQGGGLLMFGGRRTFGPGGYYQTPLDRVSPVSSRVERDAPEVAIAFVLDRSGSMQQRVGETDRLAIAKEATLAALGLLGEESRATIVAFDEEAQVIAPLQRVGDLAALRARLATLVPGGGTSILPGIEAALEQLAPSEAAARHMVVMSDGLSQPGEFERVVGRARDAEITISTVAIGRGADTERLSTIADLGDGTTHVSEDFRALPGILSQEAMLLSTSPVKEEPMRPRWTDAERPTFLDGWPNEPPILQGLVETTAKPDATMHLVGPEDEPVLASWRYGLGRVVAFPSQAVGPWSAGWQAREAFPSWWAQAARWAAASAGAAEPSFRVRGTGPRVQIELYAGRTADASPGQAAAVEVSGPEVARTVHLEHFGPRRWSAEMPATAGRYDAEVAAGPTLAVGRTGQAMVPESTAVPGDPPAPELRALALHSGGGVGPAEAAWAPLESARRWRWRPDPRVWATLAAISFIAALTLRYAPGRWRPRLSLTGRRRTAGPVGATPRRR